MRFLSLIFFLLLPLAGIRAQTFQASVIAGANMSQIDGDDLFGFHHLGANAGIRVVAKVGDRWRFGPEILFTQSGARRPNSSLNISPFSRFNFQSLEVPVMAFYKDWRITAGMGLSYQRIFSYEIEGYDGTDLTDQFEINENMAAFNAGVTFHLNPNFGVNFRWSKHIINLDVDHAINTSLRGRTISLRLIWTPGTGVVLPKPTTEE